MAKAMRQAMPQVTQWVDDLRNTFGVEMIHGAIRSGMGGKPHFWAREGEHELGTWWPNCGEKDANTSPDA